MRLERIIEALVGLGFTRLDAETYVYLAKKGPNTITILTKSLISNRLEIKRTLNNLQTKGLVIKKGILFSSIPFEEALALLIELKKEQAEAMSESKEKLLVTWETKDY